MKSLIVVCLLPMFACAAADAQDCSGGADGGTDATGNQCNAPGGLVDSVSQPAARAGSLAAIALDHPARASHADARTIGPAATRLGAGDAGPSRDRFPRTAEPPAEPVRTAKMGNPQETPCSGGSDGGMDATGNQCNDADAPGNAVLAHNAGR
jgi:hypothetical protein